MRTNAHSTLIANNFERGTFTIDEQRCLRRQALEDELAHAMRQMLMAKRTGISRKRLLTIERGDRISRAALDALVQILIMSPTHFWLGAAATKQPGIKVPQRTYFSDGPGRGRTPAIYPAAIKSRHPAAGDCATAPTR